MGKVKKIGCSECWTAPNVGKKVRQDSDLKVSALKGWERGAESRGIVHGGGHVNISGGL